MAGSITKQEFNPLLLTEFENLTLSTKGKVNVLEKGAKGDKVKADDVPIQAALDMAKLNVLANGIHVTIPAGVYRLTNRLYLWKKTRVTLEEGAVLYRDHAAGFFANGKSGDNFTGYNGNGGIIIEGGTLDGNITKWNNAYNAIGLARGLGITLRDMEIIDVRGAHAVDMNACKDVIIERVKFKGYDTSWETTGDNLSYFREAIQISNHTLEGFNLFGAFDGQPCDNVTVRDCWFGPSDKLPAWPTGVGNHGHVQGSYNTNIRVYNNTFVQSSHAGVRLFKFVDSWVERNTFIDCYDGIRHSNPDGNGSFDNGIPESGKNLWVENNTFIRSTHFDIYVAGQYKGATVARVKNVNIKNNNSEGSGLHTHIYLSFCENVFIDDPLIKGAYRGIYNACCIDVHIQNIKAYDIVTEVFYSQEDTGVQNLGYTKKLFFTGVNTSERCGRSAYRIEFVDGFIAQGIDILDSCTDTDTTRSAIIVASSAKNGKVYNSKIRGTKHKYGVEITGSTQNVQSYNNDSVGHTIKPSLNNSVGGFEGIYLHSPDGTRYKVQVANGGAITGTVG